MHHSLLTQAGIVFKRATGVKDISMLRKNIHRRIGKLIYHRKYTADDIVKVMSNMGMKAGSTVCIHSGMKEFYNYRGTATELVRKIQQAITEEGTLLMPAFPDTKYQDDDNFIFNVMTEPTKAGFLAETFRKLPGVRRSINIQHSVCAWGKHAEWLIKDHHRCENCWDENSPWQRMTELNALVFSLGLPHYYIGTFDHCVEARLHKEYPYWAQFFNTRQIYRYYDENGEIGEYECIRGKIETRTREKKLIKHFTPDIFKEKKLSNLLIKVFCSKPCLEIMTELGRKGITMYYVPSPKKYKFDSNS